MNKPVAITGLAFLLGAVGVMFLLVALGAFPLLGEAQGAGWLVGLFALIGVACSVLAYGLFTLKTWAWPLGIAMVIGSVILGILSVISRASLAGLVLAFLPALFLLGGLMLPNVRETFRRGTDRSK